MDVDFEPGGRGVTIFFSSDEKLVKEQKFPLTPDRSAGMCGRLKCCLAYETGDGASSRTKCGGRRLATSRAGDAPGEPRIPAS